ncbi:hypothetical protein HDU96_010467 [Phlyctochytrium bullatum]|nr:hypothetical protein HDU96_010467 [Phlyctochytrium bullatum]
MSGRRKPSQASTVWYSAQEFGTLRRTYEALLGNHGQMERENQNLRQEREGFLDEITRLRAENQALCRENVELEADCDMLQKAEENTRLELEGFIRSRDELQQEYDDLKTKHEHIKQSHQKLGEEFHMLGERELEVRKLFKKLHDEWMELKEKHDRLEGEHNVVKAQAEQQPKFEELRFRAEQLEKEKQSLNEQLTAKTAEGQHLWLAFEKVANALWMQRQKTNELTNAMKILTQYGADQFYRQGAEIVQLREINAQLLGQKKSATGSMPPAPIEEINEEKSTAETVTGTPLGNDEPKQVLPESDHEPSAGLKSEVPPGDVIDKILEGPTDPFENDPTKGEELEAIESGSSCIKTIKEEVGKESKILVHCDSAIEIGGASELAAEPLTPIESAGLSGASSGNGADQPTHTVETSSRTDPLREFKASPSNVGDPVIDADKKGWRRMWRKAARLYEGCKSLMTDTVGAMVDGLTLRPGEYYHIDEYDFRECPVWI